MPGPTLEARVGDVLEVRLTNRLPEPTVVHWHGLRIPAAMDGTEMVQRPIAPGHTFTYRFRLPDAGTFWYHSHLNETVQLERGLYGALIVRSAEEPRFDRERVLMFDDVELQDDGAIKPPGRCMLESHDGREGSHRLREREAGARVHDGCRQSNAGESSTRRALVMCGCRLADVRSRDHRQRWRTHRAPPSQPRIHSWHQLTGSELAVGPFAERRETSSIRIETLPFNRGSFKAHKKPESFATLRVGSSAPSRAHVPETRSRFSSRRPCLRKAGS